MDKESSSSYGFPSYQQDFRNDLCCEIRRFSLETPEEKKSHQKNHSQFNPFASDRKGSLETTRPVKFEHYSLQLSSPPKIGSFESISSVDIFLDNWEQQTNQKPLYHSRHQEQRLQSSQLFPKNNCMENWRAIMERNLEQDLRNKEKKPNRRRKRSSVTKPPPKMFYIGTSDESVSEDEEDNESSCTSTSSFSSSGVETE